MFARSLTSSACAAPSASLLKNTEMRVATIKEQHGMTQFAIVSRVMEFFYSQKPDVQVKMLGIDRAPSREK